MESKFRRLYLYASNKQANSKKPGESVEQFRLKKQKSIEHLKQLLQLKIVDSPVQNIVKDIKQQNEDPHSSVHASPSLTIMGNQQHPNISPKLPQKKQTFKKSSSISQYLEQYRKDRVERNRKKQRQYLYEKYVNQYMQKIYEQNLLEKYPQEDYTRLVQEASREIREKVNQILQNQSKLVGKQKSTDSHIAHILKTNSKKKSSEKQMKGRGVSLEESMIQTSQKKEKDRNLSVNNEKRSRSVAENNLYKLKLEKIEKVNKLKVKARKRSQKQFIRNLGRNKFLSTMTLPLI